MTQLRKYTKFKFSNWIRLIIQKFRLGYIGNMVHLEKDVRLMRFPENIFIQDEVIIKSGTKICSCNERAIIKLGSRTTIGYNSIIFSSCEIIIGEDCLIAPNVYIVDSNHGIEKGRKINEQENSSRPIHIEDDVWIANGVTILGGVTIERGAVIAANSVVNRDVGPYEIFGGSPAKLIGKRD